MAFDAFEEEQIEDEGSAREARRAKRMADREAIQMAVVEKEIEMEQVKDDKATFHQYSPMFMLAGFKDLLDLVLIGSLPVIGTIITFCFAITMFLLLKLSKTNHRLSDNRTLIRLVVVLCLGSVTEGFLFGVNFLPIQTITIFIMFMMDRSFSDKQIEQIVSILGILHKDHRARG